MTTLDSRFLLLLSWTALDGAVGIYLRVYGTNPVSTLLLVVAVATFGLACASRARDGVDVFGLSLLLVAAHLSLAAIAPFRAESPPPSDVFRVFPVLGLVGLAIAAATRHGPAGRATLTRSLWVVVGSGIAYRIAIVAADVAPPFDVSLIQRAAGQAVLHAVDPYLTHIYHGGYPYLPMAALAAAVGESLGDARWTSVIGDVLTVAGILLLASRAGARPRLGLAMAGLWVWWSGGFYVAWQDFPEPILIGFMALAAAAMVGTRPHSTGAGVLLGFAAATKQFGLGLFPFLPWRSRPGRRTLVVAVLTWLVLVVPFALLHLDQFLEGAFFSHLREPGRGYALNLLNLPGVTLDLPLAVVFALALAFGWLCERRQVLPVASWLAGSGGFLLLAFVLNRIAFVNYYAITLALMLFLVLVLAASDQMMAGSEDQAKVANQTR